MVKKGMSHWGPLTGVENRLESFNDDRQDIVSTVVSRVVARKVHAAQSGENASLEYVLNDAAYHELRRLEGSHGKVRERQVRRWRELALGLGRMNERDKYQQLSGIVRHYALEIAGNFNRRVYRFANDFFPPALSFLFSPVRSLRDGYKALDRLADQIVCEGEIEALREVFTCGTVVLTPTHTSNFDSVVIGVGLKLMGLPPVTYGAGKDLFNNPLISFFMQNAGTYKVDRRLKFSLYKEILKEYSAVLIERGYHSLFFPGGTRSRSNKIEERLKLGLLGTVQTAYQNILRDSLPRKNIYIVPVTINYRLVLEAETLIEDYFAEEGRSRYIIIDDEFSRLGRIVEFLRKLLALEESLVLRVGRPLDVLGNETSKRGEFIDMHGRPVDLASYYKGRDGQLTWDAQRDAEYTRRLGRALASAYLRDTVFMTTSLVARAVFEQVVERARTRDIYRILRLPTSVVMIPLTEIYSGVKRLCEQLSAHPEKGRLQESIQGMSAEEIVEDGLRSMSTYHTTPVLRRVGNKIIVGDMKLIYYYQNRTDHLNFESAHE